MLWSEIRKVYPHQWLIVEALEAYTDAESKRQIGRLAVIEMCADGSMAMNRYRELHRKYPFRELYFVHTDRQELDIYEQRWVGIRGENAIAAER